MEYSVFVETRNKAIALGATYMGHSTYPNSFERSFTHFFDASNREVGYIGYALADIESSNHLTVMRPTREWGSEALNSLTLENIPSYVINEQRSSEMMTNQSYQEKAYALSILRFAYPDKMFQMTMNDDNEIVIAFQHKGETVYNPYEAHIAKTPIDPKTYYGFQRDHADMMVVANEARPPSSKKPNL